MEKTRLQMLRESGHVSVPTMARAMYNIYGDACGGDTEHLMTVISAIESGGMIASPRPRKTYELRYIAQYLSELTGTHVTKDEIYK